MRKLKCCMRLDYRDRGAGESGGEGGKPGHVFPNILKSIKS